MQLKDIKKELDEGFYKAVESKGIDKLRPCQEKSLKKGLLKGKNMLVCTPTASGKTLVAELAIIKAIQDKGKAIYIVPLKALAMEKYKEFKEKYKGLIEVELSIGDLDEKRPPHIERYDLLITTSEKLDSLIRHSVNWLKYISTVVIDEIHLLNDPGRGPTLEILITTLRMLLKNVQIIGLSATIGNPDELSKWLQAELIIDKWRPVELKQGVYLNGEVEFEK